MRRYLLNTGIMGDFIDRRRGVPDKVREVQQRGASPRHLHAGGRGVYGVELSSTRDENIRRLRRVSG